jgi:hypothetical protein
VNREITLGATGFDTPEQYEEWEQQVITAALDSAPNGVQIWALSGTMGVGDLELEDEDEEGA